MKKAFFRSFCRATLLGLFGLLPFLLMNDSPEQLALRSNERESALYSPPRLSTFSTNPIMLFEQNQGQAGEPVAFLARGRGYSLYLMVNGATLALHPQQQEKNSGQHDVIGSVEMRLIGAKSQPDIEGLAVSNYRANYFIGNDPAQWRRNVPSYQKVRYREIYAGIDMIYYGRDGELEFDFVLAPGADPKQIAMRFDGADALELDANGHLQLRVGHENIAVKAPAIYQENAEEKVAVAGHYVMTQENEVGFQIDEYEPSLALVIDPVLVYSTYLGGTSDEAGLDIDVDSRGNFYVMGATRSVDFPTVLPLQGDQPNIDVFVSKFDPSGGLIFSTYLGGSASESFLGGIAVDAAGNIYVTGSTLSTNFPTKNAFQPQIAPPPSGMSQRLDAFVTKIAASGAELVFSTYLGGALSESVGGFDIDSQGNAYLSGSTLSPDYPTHNPIQTANAGVTDIFIAKFSAAGALIYSTYFGGRGNDFGDAIAVDAIGNMLVAGETESNNFPMANNAFGGNDDGYALKLNPAGNALVYSIHLGGAQFEGATGIAADANGSAYVAGYTNSQNFPVTNGVFQGTLNGLNRDAFVTKLSSAGAIDYSTYLGGSLGERAEDIAVDANGNAFVIGATPSANFPIEQAIQPNFGGGDDVFITQINSNGTALLFSSYLGGSGFETSQAGRLALAIDGKGNIYATGETTSNNFPMSDKPYQGSYVGGGDAFVVKIDTRVKVCSDVWLPRADLNASLPPSIRVFENCAIPAWLVQAAPGAWNFKTASSSSMRATGARVWSKKTVSSFASSENALVAINAGFFGGSPPVSTSLVASAGALLAANINIVSRDFVDFRPTRATFGILDNGGMDLKWTYNVVSDKALYAYPQPAENAPFKPAGIPSATFPPGGVVWKLREGIGGGPMLVMDGKVVVQSSWQHEVFFGGKGHNEKGEEVNIPPPVGNVETRDPRTAMGITRNDTLLFVIADGRCADGSTPTNGRCKDGSDSRRGMSHQEMAELMIKYRAIKAMNLDGGGSSALVVNSKLINKPSDGRERSVASAIVLAPIMTANAAAFDSGDECCYAEKGNWLESAGGSFFGSTPARLNEVGTGADRAVWRFPDITPGNYEVAAWWVPGSDRATNTPYTVFQNGVGKAVAGNLGKATATIRVNQSDPATAERWNILGTFNLSPDDSIVVTDDAAGNRSPAYVVADAVRLIAATGTGVTSSAEAPMEFHLQPNYPNPFQGTATSGNSATTIRFNLPKSARVEIAIYDLHGRQIRTLFSQSMQPGEHVVAWDGRNDAGELVASGVYFYRLQAGDLVQSRKMIFVR